MLLINSMTDKTCCHGNLAYLLEMFSLTKEGSTLLNQLMDTHLSLYLYSLLKQMLEHINLQKFMFVETEVPDRC